MKVRDVQDLLQNKGYRFNGFPVVKEHKIGQQTVEVYQGIILLQNLGVLLKRRRWYRWHAQEDRLERVYSNDPADGGTSELKTDDRAGTQNTSQMEFTSS